ncbi:hypothetical protein PLESTM_001350200 [Pleodorina starrii]|nr:hypothetical protein PLESTM_001350200 [Pleodorina starrii]
MGGPRAVAASGGRAKLLPPHATFRGGEIDEGVRCTVSSRRRGLVMACSAAATYRPTRSNPVRAPESSDDQARLGLRERNRSVVRLSRNFTLPEVTVSCLQQPQSPRVP